MDKKKMKASLNDVPEPIAEKTMTSLNDLPESIAESLLLFLDGDDLIRCGAVCSKWYQKINDLDHLWEKICLLEGITAEDHDWDLTDEWDLFRKPCYWKRIYLNFMKLAYNLRKDVYFSIAVPPAVSSADIAAYNGQTLVTNDSLNFNIYKVKDRTVEYKQTIFCEGIVNILTNTDYIVVDNKSRLWIYKLTANRYELDSVLYFNSVGVTSFYTDMPEMPDTIVEDVTPNIVRILNNKLYLKSDAILQAWDIDRKICLLNAACDDVVHDAHSVYVYFSNTITVYDADCNVKYAMNDVESVKGMFLVCNKLIVICEVEQLIDITVVYIWNKSTGVLILSKKYQISSNAIVSVINNKRNLIMLRSVKESLLAYDLEKEVFLWNITINLGHGEIRNIPKGIWIQYLYAGFSTKDGRKLNVPPLLRCCDNIIMENNYFKLYR